jgi:hypothetical protein
MPTLGVARLLASALASASFLTWPASAAAEDYALEWEAAEGCPSQDAARSMLDEYLAGSETSQNHGDASIEVRIARQDDGRFRAAVLVEARDVQVERAFSGSRCQDVAEAAALIAAMLLDPSGDPARASPQPEPTEPQDDDDLADEAPEPPPRLRWSLGVHVLGDVRSLPRLAPGGGLSGGLHWGRLHLGLRISALLPQRTEAGPTPDSGGELGLYAGSVRGGFELLRGLRGHLGTGPLAGLEGGVVVGRGRRVAVPETDRQLWLAPGLGWALWMDAAAVSLAISLEALAPLHRPSWVLDDHGELFRSPTVAGRLSLELGWLLP